MRVCWQQQKPAWVLAGFGALGSGGAEGRCCQPCKLVLTFMPPPSMDRMRRPLPTMRGCCVAERTASFSPAHMHRALHLDLQGPASGSDCLGSLPVTTHTHCDAGLLESACITAPPASCQPSTHP